MSKKIACESCVLQSNGLAIHYDIYLDLGLESSGDLGDSSVKYGAYKGVVQIAHGMIEHRAKYKAIAEFLAKNGFIVAVNDHRGHGDSINCESANSPTLAEGARGRVELAHDSRESNMDCLDSANAESHNDSADSSDKIYLGEMGENGFEMALDDMRNLCLSLKSRFKPKKFILIGHSMGSLLSRRFLQEYEDELDMLVLCGTPKPEPFVSVGIVFLKILRFFGLKNVARDFANKFSLLSFNAKYAKIDDLADGANSGTFWINRDTTELKRKLADNKQNFTFTINSFINLFVGLRRVFRPYPRKIANPAYESRLPILMVSGEDDACGGFGKGAIRAFKHLISQGYGNAKLILYANARHELFLELNKDEVFGDILAFIKQNLHKSTTKATL